MATDAAETRGRPRIRDDDEILRAALHAFSEHGYDGMSLRTLNAEMGLSRGTINQRFGSKEQL
jgi:AcrR family transcriptional regulator